MANLLAGTPLLAAGLKRAAGMAAERSVPRFAPISLQDWFRRRGSRNPGAPAVVVWPDTFTNYFDTGAGVAAVEAIEAAGRRVTMPSGHVCCGRPLYDYGFLDLARRYLLRVLESLRPSIRSGAPVVGLEPSCVATFRHELPRLLPGDEDALALSRQVVHFAELFEGLGAEPALTAARPPGKVLLWVHCHQKATGGAEADRRLLEGLGAEVEVIRGTCCGLAGSWGMEARHHDLSMACGEQGVLPAVRTAEAGTLVVANGFSCRMQIEQGCGGRRALHVAQVLRMG